MDTGVTDGNPLAPLPVGAHYVHLLDAARALLDEIATSGAPDEVSELAAHDIMRAAKTLAPYKLPTALAPGGNQRDLLGSGYPGFAPCRITELSDSHACGHVTFSRMHVGGWGAVHGGLVSALFDDVLGWLATTAARRIRTAYLHVDYRSVTPIDVRLTVDSRVDRIDDRKVYLSAELRHEDAVCAEAHALFVKLRADHA